jgi:membrane protein DedA with SNARE-associated domain
MIMEALGAAVIGLGFLIIGFLSVKNGGEKFQYGCLIGIVVLLILAILFVGLLQTM